MQRDKILFAAVQLQGARDLQEDYFLNFNDECIAVADGVGGIPHGEVAAKLACETAIWGYKQIGLRNTYWKDKKLFLKRIFRSTNMAVWQKKREEGLTRGMATTLTLAIVGSRNVWIGSVGDSPAYFFHHGTIQKVTEDDHDAEGYLVQSIGTDRYRLAPHVYAIEFVAGDSVLLATDGFTHFLSEQAIARVLSGLGDTSQEVSDGVISLLREAEKNGSDDNMTACIIKRIRN